MISALNLIVHLWWFNQNVHLSERQVDQIADVVLLPFDVAFALHPEPWTPDFEGMTESDAELFMRMQRLEAEGR